MNLPTDAEQLLQETIFPELERGRGGYDKPHTIGVVQKVRDLVKHNPHLDLDEAVLVIVAYAHDWGYADLFNNKEVNSETVKDAKKEHMIISAQKIKTLLHNSVFDFLSPKQKERIIHLVSVHDQLDRLIEDDELIFMEADTLGVLDLTFVKPTFDKESNDTYMKGTLQKRLKMFKKEYGKTQIVRLIEERTEYYSDDKS